MSGLLDRINSVRVKQEEMTAKQTETLAAEKSSQERAEKRGEMAATREKLLGEIAANEQAVAEADAALVEITNMEAKGELDPEIKKELDAVKEEAAATKAKFAELQSRVAALNQEMMSLDAEEAVTGTKSGIEDTTVPNSSTEDATVEKTPLVSSETIPVDAEGLEDAIDILLKENDTSRQMLNALEEEFDALPLQKECSPEQLTKRKELKHQMQLLEDEIDTKNQKREELQAKIEPGNYAEAQTAREALRDSGFSHGEERKEKYLTDKDAAIAALNGVRTFVAGGEGSEYSRIRRDSSKMLEEIAQAIQRNSASLADDPEQIISTLDESGKQALKNILSKVEGPLLHNYQRIRDQQWTAWALRGHAEDKNDVPFSNQKDMAQELVHLSSMVGFSNAGYPLRFIVNLQKALKSHTSTEKK